MPVSPEFLLVRIIRIPEEDSPAASGKIPGKRIKRLFGRDKNNAGGKTNA